MNFTKSILRRVLGGLFALALVAVSFPMAAFALETGVQLSRKNFAFDGENFSTDGPDATATAKLGGTYIGNNWRVSEDNTADLWIYSTDMESAGEADGSTVPYVIDGAGQKWVLKEIAIANYKTIGGDGEYNDFQVVMTSDQIEAASTKADYIIDTTNLNITPYPLRPTIPYYYVWYGWELADAVEDLKEYNISYDLKLPTDDIPENSMSLYPVLSAGSVDAADSNGSLTAVNDYVTKLGATVYSNQNYTVSDFNSVHDGAKYTDFLVFNYKNNSDYYTFDGWTVKGKDNTVYPIGKELTPDDMANLVDENNNITFVGKWTKIEPMTNEELQKALANLTLNALVGVDSQPLITQSVNGEPVTNDVELKEDDIISYTVQARLGSDIIGSSDGNGMTVQKDFAQFTYQVKVDSNLEFTNLNDDGTVILTFTAQKFEPTKTNIEGATISGGPGNWTITIDPENVPEEDGSLYIEVTMESMESSLSDINEPIVLSGLDFKLKASAVNDDVTLSTSANVVGSIDLHKKTQLRGYYQTVNFFMSYPDWKNYFNAGQDTPTAVAHASQFIDSKLTKIDLANDNMGLKANTCKATFVKPTYGIRVFVYDKATEKEDGSATGLANAAFALYKAEDVALAPDGSVMINQGATALKSGTTGADGYMTLGDLDEGTYYLFETQAPAGYAKNAQPWKITLPTDADTQTNMADVKIAYTLIPQTTEPDDDKPGEHQPSSTNGSGSVSDSTSGNTSGSTQNTETTQTQTTGSTAAAAAAASAIPQTSDESNPVLWTVLFLASGMTLAGITLCRRKTARHRS